MYGVDSSVATYKAVVDELYDEASLLAAIRHDRIISFQGITLDHAGRPKYVLTELALGSMKQYLTTLGRRVTVDEMHGYCVDIFSGLAYLHELTPKAIVHRDLKPDNVLAFEIRRGVVVMKLGDVGLAKFISSTSFAAHSTAGSLFYMSPEVSLSRPYDGRADVFSAGTTLCEMIVRFMLEEPWVPEEIYRNREKLITAAVAHLQSCESGGNTAVRLADALRLSTVMETETRLTSRQVLELLSS